MLFDPIRFSVRFFIQKPIFLTLFFLSLFFIYSPKVFAFSCAGQTCANPAFATDGDTICVNNYSDFEGGECLFSEETGPNCNLRQAINLANSNLNTLTICILRPEDGESSVYPLLDTIEIERPEGSTETDSPNLTITADTGTDVWRPIIRPYGTSFSLIIHSLGFTQIKGINFSGEVVEPMDSITRSYRCLFHRSTGQLAIEEADFNKCKVTLGSGGAILSRGPLTVKKSSFRNNSAERGSGAIDQTAPRTGSSEAGFMYHDAEITIEQSYFAHNTVFGESAQGGGAVQVYSVSGRVTNSTFYDNKVLNEVSSRGGAIDYFVHEDQILDFEIAPELHLDNLTFVYNQANRGSAIGYKYFGDGEELSALTISNSVFVANLGYEESEHSDCFASHVTSDPTDKARIESLGNNYWDNLGDCDLKDSFGTFRAEDEACFEGDFCPDDAGMVRELVFNASDVDAGTFILVAPAGSPYHTHHFYLASDYQFEGESELGGAYDFFFQEIAAEDCPSVDQAGAFRYPQDSSATVLCALGSVQRICGDGLLQLGEICDDGNNQDSDACSSDCLTADYSFYDQDGDFYLNSDFNSAQFLVSDYIATDYSLTDCDDEDALIFPGQTEQCDQVDNNCDGFIDEGLATSTYYLDADGDGFGNEDNSLAITTCSTLMAGYALNNNDCDDGVNTINPAAQEICDDGLDNNCDGQTDTDLACNSEGETPNDGGGEEQTGSGDGSSGGESTFSNQANSGGGCSLNPQNTQTHALFLFISVGAFFGLLAFWRVSFIRDGSLFAKKQTG